MSWLYSLLLAPVTLLIVAVMVYSPGANRQRMYRKSTRYRERAEDYRARAIKAKSAEDRKRLFDEAEASLSLACKLERDAGGK